MEELRSESSELSEIKTMLSGISDQLSRVLERVSELEDSAAESHEGLEGLREDVRRLTKLVATDKQLKRLRRTIEGLEPLKNEEERPSEAAANGSSHG